MAKIIKKSSGAVLVTDINNQMILPTNCVVKLAKSDTVIEFWVGRQMVLSLVVSTVTHTQIEPAAEVAFSGDGFDLLELLANSFFFEVSGIGVANIKKYSATLRNVTTLSPSFVPILTLPLPDNSLVFVTARITAKLVGSSTQWYSNVYTVRLRTVAGVTTFTSSTNAGANAFTNPVVTSVTALSNVLTFIVNVGTVAQTVDFEYGVETETHQY